MTERSQDRIPLEDEATAGADAGHADPRPRLPEPLPVSLVAVEDVRLTAPRGSEEKLALFYVGLLGFERIEGAAELTFRAENFHLRFTIADAPLAHQSLRPQGMQVLDLAALEKRFIEAELEYTRERGTTPGRETLLLLDPAGNWVEIGEIRVVM